MGNVDDSRKVYASVRSWLQRSRSTCDCIHLMVLEPLAVLKQVYVKPR